ncbi:hypothetical protein CDL15_Pgr017514 [Punica granatum]|uniref:Uncharacterized protein n=1 Tax=Punica granatum TaxID=22663 RepID=A0A218W5M8_PUNGR|nr:hypothetical protein CDL15_Pgr017514 [Punica granatum]
MLSLRWTTELSKTKAAIEGGRSRLEWRDVGIHCTAVSFPPLLPRICAAGEGWGPTSKGRGGCHYMQPPETERRRGEGPFAYQVAISTTSFQTNSICSEHISSTRPDPTRPDPTRPDTGMIG